MPALVAVLCFLSFQGVCMSRSIQQSLRVRQGEMVVLQCSCFPSSTTGNFTWTHPSDTLQTRPGRGPSYGAPPLVHRDLLVVLRASAERQGNYSCTLGNSSCSHWFNLTVSPTSPNVDPLQFCTQGTSCTLSCSSILNIPSLRHMETVWHKGKNTSVSSSDSSFDGFFREVSVANGGVYTCRHSYRHHEQLYNHTCTTKLKVKEARGSPEIKHPKTGTYPVHLGSQLVVPCVALTYSNSHDDVYWRHDRSFVSKDPNQMVYSKKTIEMSGEERTITVSLVFQKVTEDQLSGNYTCQLVSTLKSSYVTITLALIALPVSVHMVAGLAVLFVLLLVVSSTLIFIRWRVHITLVLRDTLGCHGNASDEKLYDAYVLTYESQARAALSQEERRWMENVLEEQLGYRLCLHERDVSPGEAVADAVMRCILQSRRVILVPSSVNHPDVGLGSGLPCAIHAALVEKKSRLVLILTKTTQEEEEVSLEPPQGGGSPSLPESLRLLTQDGSSVTWRGACSRSLSSSFWKHLRYSLPAPRKLRAMHSLDSVC